MKIYLATLASLLAIDFVWLKFLAKDFYQRELAHLFSDKFLLFPAGIFYLIYAFGIVFFVLKPGIEAKSLEMVLYRGALLGLITYAAYDLTNHATLSRWPLSITITDMIWGVCLTTITSALVYYWFK